MRRKILIFTMLLSMTFLTLPLDSFASGTPAQDRWERRHRSQSGRYWNDDHNGRRRRRYRRNTNYFGYRNYGQYRRTQVGNRRYRMVRRYYYNDGTRLSRWVRVYY